MEGVRKLLKDSIVRDLARIEATQHVIVSMLQSITAQLAQQTGTSELNPVKKTDTANVVGEATTAEIALFASMSPKQHATMLCVVAGWRNADIAEQLRVTDNTVKQHLRAVMKKLGVGTRGQVALVASDIIERMSSSEYKKTSGGLPSDWAVNVDGSNDPYYQLYAPVRDVKNGVH
tara:strand:+ start:10056 stop:10583 length:528 start_codon:yes stop_codon:yes gene_type:complete